MLEKVFVSLVVYLYNQEKEVDASLPVLNRFLSETFSDYEIILVDDCSTDRTLEQVRLAAEKLPNGHITVIRLSRRHGVEQAMAAGLNRSMGDFVYELESLALPFDTSVLLELFHQTRSGIDIAAASTSRISLQSRLFYWLVNKVSYLQLDLTTEVARLVSRRALNAMLNLKEKVRYRKALYAYTGYPKATIEIPAAPGTGTGAWAVPRRTINRERLTLAIDILVSFSNIGLKVSLLFSLLFLLFSMGMMGYSLYHYLFNKNVVEGWTTLMILLSTGFAGLFFILGVLGEYMTRMLVELQARPAYSVRSVEVIKKRDAAGQKERFAQQEVAAASDDQEVG